MIFFTAVVLAAVAGADAALERSYTDDLGITHTTKKEKPTIVTFAHTATSLFDYGKKEQTKVQTKAVPLDWLCYNAKAPL